MTHESAQEVPRQSHDLPMHTLQTATLGAVRVFPFSSSSEGEGDGIAVMVGSPESAPAPLLRMHSRCLYGEFLESKDCDCGPQAHEAMRLICEERTGIFCYLDQEGRGKGLMKKALAYEYMQKNRVDTVQAYSDLHYGIDPRGYSHVVRLLRRAGILKVRLMTNNPRKVRALEEGGIDVERVPVVTGINPWNAGYLTTKSRKLGHMIDADRILSEVMGQTANGHIEGEAEEPPPLRDDFSGLNVVVLGGLVMDVFIRTPELPGWGRAVQADSLTLRPGGKGLNQAIAARRLGAQVSVIGAVGRDEFGDRILTELDEHGIDRAGVATVRDATSPVTVVFSQAGGETAFAGWKNADAIRVDRDLVLRHAKTIQKADILLTTLEVSPEAVTAAVELASNAGALTVLNPAPPLQKPGHNVADLPLRRIDLLVPNEWEARELAGLHGVADLDLRDLAAFLAEPDVGARSVCVTRAGQGCALWKDGQYQEYPAYSIETQDGTGASDVFCATLALYLRAGNRADASIKQAQAAGAWAVTKIAAVNTPTRDQLRDHARHLDRSLRSAAPVIPEP